MQMIHRQAAIDRRTQVPLGVMIRLLCYHPTIVMNHSRINSREASTTVDRRRTAAAVAPHVLNLSTSSYSNNINRDSNSDLDSDSNSDLDSSDSDSDLDSESKSNSHCSSSVVINDLGSDYEDFPFTPPHARVMIIGSDDEGSNESSQSEFSLFRQAVTEVVDKKVKLPEEVDITSSLYQGATFTLATYVIFLMDQRRQFPTMAGSNKAVLFLTPPSQSSTSSRASAGKKRRLSSPNSSFDDDLSNKNMRTASANGTTITLCTTTTLPDWTSGLE